MSGAAGPDGISDNLTLCLDAANLKSYPGSGATWSDMSGNGYNASAVNSPTFSSANGGAITFNGSNQKYQSTYYTATTPFGNNNTWEAWVYCTSNASTYNMYMGAYLPYFSFYTGNSIIFSNVYGGAQQSIQSDAGTVSLNSWYHIACTSQYNSGPATTTMNIYINGSLSKTGTATGVQTTSSTTYFSIGDGVGSNVYATWYPFAGSVSCVRIYSKALSSAEILQNFRSLRSRFGV